jgi:hypothetical protein
MSYGFLAVNNNNQVLVSSDTRNLHFVGKYTWPSSFIKNESGYGGINIVNYRVTCNVTPVPFFTMPNSSDFYSIGRISQVDSTTWDIEVVKSGAATDYPEIYIFSDPRGATSSETHGMIVYRDDSTPSFDSRLRPLAITHSFNITQPSAPRVSIAGGLSARYCESTPAQGDFFLPTEVNSVAVSQMPDKPMFFYASLAQAEKEDAKYESDEDAFFGIFGFLYADYYEWWSTYWAFYRGAVRKPSSTEIQAGWLTINHDCNWAYRKDSGGFFGFLGGGGSRTGGIQPYSNETINLSSTSFLIANASRYD